jgi:hypothetical protein
LLLSSEGRFEREIGVKTEEEEGEGEDGEENPNGA